MCNLDYQNVFTEAKLDCLLDYRVKVLLLYQCQLIGLREHQSAKWGTKYKYPKAVLMSGSFRAILLYFVALYTCKASHSSHETSEGLSLPAAGCEQLACLSCMRSSQYTVF